ncbi:MAG: acetylserotonin O-methyltransferase [Fimbriiglobus sp.]|jgi:acetylserotonin N-methyltransferase|nr:acetylserotonin O-methyltransferase [Fimbriiglobus sp.]
MTDLTPPDPAPVLDLISAFRRTQVLFTACELTLFDALGTPKTCSQLAGELNLNADALERLLGACVMLGLLRKVGDTYANTPAADAYLTTASPHRMLGYINYSNAVLWKLWDNLPDAIREGTHRWKQTFGTDGPIFAQLFRTPADQREFLLGMHGYGLMSSPQVVNAVDLGRYKTFVDLGGATGHLATAACQRWPNLNAVVFDLPQVIGLSQEIVNTTPVADRVKVIGGDFFADELPPGDVYALGRILHDWTEEKITKLLAKIHAALPPGGAVLIAEKVLHDDKAGPDWAVTQSLNMLLVTEGKERTLGEYAKLLEAAGFRHVTCHRTPAPLDALMAVK